MAAVTFTKLRDGSWGLRGPDLTPGDTVTVSKADGSTSRKTVGRVVWRGDGVCLATIAGDAGASNGRSSKSRRGGGGVCAECGRGGSLVSDLEDGLMKHYGCCDIPP